MVRGRLLRGDYQQANYGKVILLFTVLRCLNGVLESTKADVLAEKKLREKAEIDAGLNTATCEMLRMLHEVTA